MTVDIDKALALCPRPDTMNLVDWVHEASTGWPSALEELAVARQHLLSDQTLITMYDEAVAERDALQARLDAILDIVAAIRQPYLSVLRLADQIRYAASRPGTGR